MRRIRVISEYPDHFEKNGYIQGYPRDTDIDQKNYPDTDTKICNRAHACFIQ